MPTAKQLARSLAALAQVGDEAHCAKFLQQLGQLPLEAQASIRRAALATVERTSTGQEVLQRQFEQYPLPKLPAPAQVKSTPATKATTSHPPTQETLTVTATGRVEVTVKFQGIPDSQPDGTGRTRIEIHCGDRLFWASLKNKSFNKFCRAAEEAADWVGALKGNLGQIQGNQFEVTDAGLQCFEKQSNAQAS